MRYFRAIGVVRTQQTLDRSISSQNLHHLRNLVSVGLAAQQHAQRFHHFREADALGLGELTHPLAQLMSLEFNVLQSNDHLAHPLGHHVIVG